MAAQGFGEFNPENLALAGIDTSVYPFLERVASQSMSKAGFGIDGGKAVVPYFVNPALTPVEEAIRTILGDVRADCSGSLQRSLPKAHPKFKWLFAERISDITGIGTGRIVQDEEDFEAPPIVGAYWEHPLYIFTVEFTFRYYQVLSDQSITVQNLEWCYDDGRYFTSYYANEWHRFTDYDYMPQPETAYAQHGQMKFRTFDNAPPGGYPFSGYPRMMIPNATVKFRWYQVPFSYVEHAKSGLVRWIGRINQVDWYGWDAGSLLYVGLTVSKRYPPPIPDREVVYLEDGTSTIGFSSEKLCDLELVFLYTDRKQDDVPVPYNGNWITAGHNLQPWIHRKEFFYATSAWQPRIKAGTSIEGGTATEQHADENESKWVPTYLSIPFQFLFTDPCAYDLAQAGSPAGEPDAPPDDPEVAHDPDDPDSPFHVPTVTGNFIP